MAGLPGHVRKRGLGKPTGRDKQGRPTYAGYSYQARIPAAHRGGQPGVLGTYATKRQAELRLADWRLTASKNPGHDPERARAPFRLLVEDWQRVRWGGLAPKSRARYEQVLREHLMPAFGNARVGEITRERVRDFLAGLTNERKVTRDPEGNETEAPRYATGTVLKVRTCLSSVMSEAVERGMVATNPCHGLKGLPKAEPRRMLFLTAAEVQALAEAIDPQYRALIYVAAYTGLRAGELHALRRRDVDTMSGRLTVERALKIWRAGTPVFGKTKSDKARGVDLAPQIRDLLAAHLARPRSGGAGAPQPTPTPDSLLFTNAAGGAIHQVAWLRNHFKPAVKTALPNYAGRLRFHDLRHTYVSFLIAGGIHPRAIQEQAGHASITTTMDRYGHLLPSAGEGVKAALSATFAAAPAAIPVTPLRAA